MKAVFIIALSVLIVSHSFAQSTETDSISKSKISQLEFMVGSWKGSGWMMGRDEVKSEFDQTEEIHFKLDSTMVMVEGVGKSQGKIVHNALAILTYNKLEDKYSFRSYLQNGQWYEMGEFLRGESWMQFFEMTLDSKN